MQNGGASLGAQDATYIRNPVMIDNVGPAKETVAKNRPRMKNRFYQWFKIYSVFKWLCGLKPKWRRARDSHWPNPLADNKSKVLRMSKRMHVADDSPNVRRHHMNWRWQAIAKAETCLFSENLFFTAPVVLSRRDVEKINAFLLKTLEDFRKISGPSENEELFCLNVDWFRVGK